MLVIRLRKYIHHLSVWVLPFILLMSACIEEFDPEIKDYNDILVIDGTLIKGDSIQEVVISKSTQLYGPEFKPVSACVVMIIDNSEQEFIFEETKKGIYTSAIPDNLLSYDSQYQLSVRTPDGNEYLSGFETISESSPIDSIYYITEEYQSSSEQFEEGLQFYADLKAPDEATKNYLWTLEETWEIRTVYDIDGFWDKTSYKLPLYSPRDSLSYCWSTEPINHYYTSSTENLVVNEKKKIPLNFVGGISPKLNFLYSLLVKQYSLSDKAYKYHSQNNFATAGSEQLYQTQPGQSRSNIHNINNPEELVLGYFWASSYSERRLIFRGPLTTTHADCDNLVLCIPKMGQTLLQLFRGLGRDMYLVAMNFSPTQSDSVVLWAYPKNQICIDCRFEGGSTKKPDFLE